MRTKEENQNFAKQKIVGLANFLVLRIMLRKQTKRLIKCINEKSFNLMGKLSRKIKILLISYE